MVTTQFSISSLKAKLLWPPLHMLGLSPGVGSWAEENRSPVQPQVAFPRVFPVHTVGIGLALAVLLLAVGKFPLLVSPPV